MNIISIFVTFLQLTFFGLLVAFNPLLLVSQLAIILRSRRPLMSAVVFAAGAATPLLLLAVIGTFLFNEHTDVKAFNFKVELSPMLNILIGLVLSAIGIRLKLVHVVKPKSTQGVSDKTAHLSFVPLFLFAFFRSAISFTSIIGIVAATKVIKDLTDNYILVILGLLWTICIGMIPFAGVIGYSIKRPQSIRAIEERVDPFLHRDYRPALAWFCICFGLYMVLFGTQAISL